MPHEHRSCWENMSRSEDTDSSEDEEAVYSNNNINLKLLINSLIKHFKNQK